MNYNRIRLSVMAALVLLGSAPSAAALATADQPCAVSDSSSGQDCLDRLTLSSGATLPYYHTYPLSGSDAAKQAVVVVHGTGRNAQGYFESMVAAAKQAGAESSAAVIAPWFQTEEENPEGNDAYWTNGGTTSWKDGGGAVEPEGLSSFATVDELVRVLADKARFPNLTRITLVGHSAGGQFVQRYAAGGRAPAQLSGVTVRYVAANPSSYLYLDAHRPVDDGLPDSCPAYDDYKYGMQHRNAYLAALSADQLVDQYVHRDVTYLLGGDDVHHDHGIDLECPAMAQGDNRLERGRAYYAAVHRSYPSAPHRLVEVPGVGHDHDAMFSSEQGRTAIFG